MRKSEHSARNQLNRDNRNSQRLKHQSWSLHELCQVLCIHAMFLWIWVFASFQTVGIGLPVILLSILGTLSLPGCIIQPTYEGLSLVLLHIVLKSSVDIPGGLLFSGKSSRPWGMRRRNLEKWRGRLWSKDTPGTRSPCRPSALKLSPLS